MPRILAPIRRAAPASAGFNEAGAFCPGYWRRVGGRLAEGEASMRPGHFAPDIEVWSAMVSSASSASMRPGHFAPDIPNAIQSVHVRLLRFNEAGAFCPGYFRDGHDHEAESGEASMRPGHFAPDIGRGAALRHGGDHASMRPGHFAPDISESRAPRPALFRRLQ